MDNSQKEPMMRYGRHIIADDDGSILKMVNKSMLRAGVPTEKIIQCKGVGELFEAIPIAIQSLLDDATQLSSDKPNNKLLIVSDQNMKDGLGITVATVLATEKTDGLNGNESVAKEILDLLKINNIDITFILHTSATPDDIDDETIEHIHGFIPKPTSKLLKVISNLVRNNHL